VTDRRERGQGRGGGERERDWEKETGSMRKTDKNITRKIECYTMKSWRGRETEMEGWMVVIEMVVVGGGGGGGGVGDGETSDGGK